MGLVGLDLCFVLCFVVFRGGGAWVGVFYDLILCLDFVSLLEFSLAWIEVWAALKALTD